MSSLWVMAKSGAARYFESVIIRSPPFIAVAFSAGHGVPLHTLMLITVTKRMYLVNGYSVVKELREACKNPLTFPKEKVRGLSGTNFYFSRIFLSLANILRFRSLIVFCGMPEMLDHSLSDNS